MRVLTLFCALGCAEITNQFNFKIPKQVRQKVEMKKEVNNTKQSPTKMENVYRVMQSMYQVQMDME